MILQRISNSIRKQDWVTVLMETLIVVLGVFLGLQVNNWNDASRQQAREAYVLSELSQDIENIENMALVRVESYRGKAASADRIMAFLSSGQAAPDDRAVFLDDLNNLMFRLPPVQRSPAFEELQSSGNLQLIENDKLRTALVRFDIAMQQSLRADEVIIDFWIRYGDDVGRKIVLSDELAEEGFSPRYAIGSYDLAAMRGDPEMLSSVSWLKRMSLISAGANLGIAREAATIKSLLEAAQ